MQCTLGGFEDLQGMKAEKRSILGLPPLPEDSIKVIRNMRAASPPASASDLIEQQQKRGRREHKVRFPVTSEDSQGAQHTEAWSLDKQSCWKFDFGQLVRMTASRAGTLCPQLRASL